MESVTVTQVEGMTNAEVLDQLFAPITAFELVSERTYHNAVDGLKQMAHAYYVGQAPLVTDANYDDLKRQLAAYEENHPKEVRPDSPIGKPAGGVFEPEFSLEPSREGVVVPS